MELREFEDEVGRHAGRKALWFTVTPIVAIVMLFGIVAVKQRWLSATDRIYAFADSSSGMAVGMAVKIQGFSIGAVTSMALVPPESGNAPRVRLMINVDRENMTYIAKDSVLKLSRDGLIGQSVLEIARGDPRARRAADGDVLVFERPRGLNEVVDDLTAKINPLIQDVRAITVKLKDPDGDLMRALAMTRETVHHVDETVVSVGRLAKTGDRVVNGIGLQAERSLKSAGNILQRTEDAMPKVEGVMQNALEASQHVNATVSRASDLLDGGQQVVGDAQQMVHGAKRSWPFNRLLPAEPSSVVDVDSQDNGKSFVVPAEAKGEK